MQVAIEHTYNSQLDALSVAIAILASFTALDLAARVQATAGKARALWIAGGATATCIGIWSMHFVGMLAFDVARPARYQPALVVLSVAVAIGASAFALWAASRDGVGLVRTGAAAVAMGAAVAGMHYIRMALARFTPLSTGNMANPRGLPPMAFGLAVTVNFLLMGFDVRVTSEVGVGSTFSIVISPWENAQQPAAALKEAEPMAAPTIARIEAPTRPVLALIIDDDPDARVIQSQHLRDLGCEVSTAASADEGIAIARRLIPDLITLDVMRPRKSGMEALHEFKTIPAIRDIPIVMVSVVAEQHRGHVLGAAECLDKPVTSEMLAAVLYRNVDLVSDLGGLVARVRNRPRAISQPAAASPVNKQPARRTAVMEVA